MEAVQRAYLECCVARAVWRACKDAEGQVAHLLLEDRAERGDLVEWRGRTKRAREAHQTAQGQYNKLAVLRAGSAVGAVGTVGGRSRRGGH